MTYPTAAHRRQHPAQQGAAVAASKDSASSDSPTARHRLERQESAKVDCLRLFQLLCVVFVPIGLYIFSMDVVDWMKLLGIRVTTFL